MSLIVAIALVATPEEPPRSASCAIVESQTEDGTTSLSVECPVDVPAAEQLAERALVAAPDALANRRDNNMSGEPSVGFYWLDGEWIAARRRAQTREPRIPYGPVGRGISGVCLTWMEVSAGGEPDRARARCATSDRRSNGTYRYDSNYVRSSVEAIRGWEFEPGDRTTVETTCFTYQMDPGDPPSSIIDPPCEPAPDFTDED